MTQETGLNIWEQDSEDQYDNIPIFEEPGSNSVSQSTPSAGNIIIPAATLRIHEI